MINVKTKDIDFSHRYYKVELFGIYNDPYIIKKNLEKLYAYIDEKEGGNLHFKYGKAYRKILVLARRYTGTHKYIISKRQVANLIKVYSNDECQYIKIPYTADYIFRAIFSILETYKNNGSNDIPTDIIQMFGKLRRDCFYKEQSLSLAELCRHSNVEPITRRLNDDLNSEGCSLGKKV